MILRNPGPLSLVLSVASVGLLACFAYFAYQTGCTADLKTGSLGDPQEAVRLSGFSLACLAAGLASGSLASATARGIDSAFRAGRALAFFVLGGAAFWLVGAFLEAAAVRACFAA
jgi:hypothetical protein